MRSAVLLITIATTLSLGGVAQAERPRGSYVDIPDEYLDTNVPTGHNSNIIFLNRCKGGCTFTSGGNDSRTNKSYIIRPGTLSEWGKGDAQWEELVSCVTAMYDPYNIVITDVDPGPNVEHFEAIVAGTSAQAGTGNGVLGIAPYNPNNCGVLNNSITFSFANEPYFASGIAGICSTVAQESAHAFGLDHEYLCSDPMTYLNACGYQWFQDENAACGEFDGPRACRCGSSQNSHRVLETHFGPGANPGPKLKFARPQPNSNVEGEFVIELDDDNYYFGVENVELLVNGEVVGTSNFPPYIFNAPAGLSGITTLEVRGTDARGYQGSVTAEVNVGSACSAGDCTDGRVCYKSFCIPGASEEGGFGSVCSEDNACNSSICAKDETGEGTCVDKCDLNMGQCPDGFGCLKAGETNVCFPGVSEDTGGCGCNSGNSGSGTAGLLLIFLGLAWQRRRRQRS